MGRSLYKIEEYFLLLLYYQIKILRQLTVHKLRVEIKLKIDQWKFW